jgi:hypothetical protein
MNAIKCEHGFCGHTRNQKTPEKRWNARLAVVSGPRRILVCESCRDPVVTIFRREGNDPAVEPLDSAQAPS